MSAVIHLHGALTAAAAQKVLREIGHQLKQNGRGHLSVVFKPCDQCRSPVCSEMGICMRPDPLEAA